MLAIDEWCSSDAVVSCLVSSHETVRFFAPAVVPFHRRDGAIRASAGRKRFDAPTLGELTARIAALPYRGVGEPYTVQILVTRGPREGQVFEKPVGKKSLGGFATFLRPAKVLRTQKAARSIAW